MNPLAIYFGPKQITIVETKGGHKVANTAELPQTVMSSGDLDDRMPADVKMVETVGFFRGELRKNNIESKEVTLCLPGQDVFVRTFEMPAMDQDELQSAINFEVEKYIPFKAEHLVSDFQVRFEKQTRTNLILFIGIKKDTLDRYFSLTSQLGLKVVGIEYAGFSLLRGVQLSGGKFKGVTAVMGGDFSNTDEINFIVLENGFPLFSRDIPLMGGSSVVPSDLEVPGTKSAENDTKDSVERLKTEIRVSLDYYERKFPTKTIKKLVLVSKAECRPDIEAFAREVGFEFSFVDLRKNIGGAFPYSLGIVKAYLAGLSKDIKIPVKLNLVSAKDKARQTKERSFQSTAKPISLFEGIAIDFKYVVIGAVICAGLFGYGTYQLKPVQQALRDVIAQRPEVKNVNSQGTVEELRGLETELTRKLGVLNSIVKKQLFFTDALNAVPMALPKAVWLTNLSLDKAGGEDVSSLTLDGVAYLADSTKEFDAVYQFVAQLTSNPNFSKYFKAVSVGSISRSQMYTLPVTNFTIICRTLREKG